MALITGGYILMRVGPREIVSDIRRRPALILWTSALDTLGWVAYSYSMTLLPLAVATGISEGYIALAVSLGLTFNKEKIKKHQVIGLILTIAAAIALSIMVES